MDGLSARRRSFTATLVVAALLAGALTAFPTSPPRASAQLSGKLVPREGALFGAYTPPSSGYSRGQVERALTRREQQLGRVFDISQEYYSWGKTFPTWRQPWDVSRGRIPLISWAAAKTSRVNSGEFDEYIRARADGIRKLGAPVFLRWFSEMDGDYQADKAISPAAFIAAWRRIQRIFANRGASNVVWVWCPTTWGFEIGKAQAYYPGDAHVDWICADGFNWAPKRPGSKWRSFESIFQAFYEFGQSHGKPLMVGEAGTEEDPTFPGRKANWVNAARDAIKNRMRNIKAFVYFDMKRTHDEGITYDWRMDTSPGSLRAFTEMARDPYFRWKRVYRPDALVRGKRGGFVGDGVYAGRQKAKGPLRRRGVATFRIKLQNDGNIGDVYTVRGTGGGKRLRTRFFLAKRNVTKDVLGPGLLLSEMEPGEFMDLTVKVRARRKGAGKPIRVTVTSESERHVSDKVVAKVRRSKKRS